YILFQCSGDHQALHSFPTRRSSDLFTMDASLNKTFALTERFRLQLRGEAFNVLNHYAFPLARFNSNPNDANFGSLFPGRISTVEDRKSTRLNSSHVAISYAVFCLKK